MFTVYGVLGGCRYDCGGVTDIFNEVNLELSEENKLNLAQTFGLLIPIVFVFQRSACCCQSFSAAPELPSGQESVLPTTKIPKYRGKLTKQDSPAQTVWNKHDKKIPKSHFTQSTQLFSQFICTPPFDCVSHKWT